MVAKVSCSVAFFLLTVTLSIAQSRPVSMDINPTSTEDDIKKKVVFIIVDGISADMLEAANTPYLDSIAKQGAYSRAYVGGLKGGYSETPTISAVGYNSLLTGTWVNKHNVYGNDIKEPNYNYPSIFKILKENFESKKAAIFSTWLDNRTKLVGENLVETGYIKMDYAFDGFELDTLRFPHDEERLFIKNIDSTVAEEASRYIKAEGPDLSWVYLEFSDDIGHKYGDSPQLNAAITYEDRLVGKIWKAVTERALNFKEEWLILVTTDHGRTQKNGKGHGGQSERERSIWVVTNSKDTNAYFKENTPTIVDLMPTMLRFLNLSVDDHLAYEIDGIPLIGKTDVFNLQAARSGTTIRVSWQNQNASAEKAQILLSKTNNFREGGRDVYEVVGEVSLNENEFIISSIPPSDFLKIVLKSEHNVLNTWLVKN
jgi:hypothetical protein